ncbi:tocopherol cyclase family protein [Lachnospiraceae bacterium 54-53]
MKNYGKQFTCKRKRSLRKIKELDKEIRTRGAVVRDSIRDFLLPFFSGHKRTRYFEGWYFKHQNEDAVLAFIPGQSIDEKGGKHPFLQIIWNESSCSLDFKEEDYLVDRRQGKILLGNNVFSRRGVKLNIRSEGISIQGIIRYGSLSPIRYSIMGPFLLLPFMECSHEIVSMSHALQGKMRINGKVLDFNGEQGYLEGDRGRSFPSDYLWLQCNRFSGEASIMVSVAHIPFPCHQFQGCIAVIWYQGTEYRFATYLGAKIVCRRETAVILRQGSSCLKVFLSNQGKSGGARFSHELLAPEQGRMGRTIREEHLRQGRFLLYRKEELVFDLTSSYVSFEYAERAKGHSH